MKTLRFLFVDGDPLIVGAARAVVLGLIFAGYRYTSDADLTLREAAAAFFSLLVLRSGEGTLDQIKANVRSTGTPEPDRLLLNDVASLLIDVARENGLDPNALLDRVPGPIDFSAVRVPRAAPHGVGPDNRPET